MDVKAAVQTAKKYIAYLYEDEDIKDIGLKEIENEAGIWNITIGFARPWSGSLIGNLAAGRHARDYRVVRVRESDGEVLSVKQRENVF